MDMGDIASLIGGFSQTRLGLDERDFQREQTRRKARLDILSAALPSITDPTLKAEALAMAEEFATGKTTARGKAKEGGLSQILGKLIGTGAQDVGQGGRLSEFMTRPREGMVRAPATGTVELPEVPGVFPAEARRVPLPGVTETIRGPFPTMEEQQQQRAAGIRGETFARGEATAEIEAAQRQRLGDEARRLGLTDPRDIANYVNQRTLPSEARDLAVNVPGEMLGKDLRLSMAVDSLGNLVRDDTRYRVRARQSDNKIVEAYPLAPTATGLQKVWFEDAQKPGTFFMANVNPAVVDPSTGQAQVVSVVRGGMPPPEYLQSVTHVLRATPVIQADGSYRIEFLPTTTTRGRVLPSAGPQPGAGGARPAGAQPRPALPPVPGAPTGVQPGQVVGAKPAPEPVVKTADGRTVVGHKAMTVADRRDIGSVALSLYLANELNGLLNAPDPANAERRLRDRTGGWEQVSDALKARWGATRYTTLGMTSGSQFLQKAMPLSNLARVIFASPYLKGVRAYQWVQDIQRHIPDATKQSPAAMGERLDVLVPVLQNMRKDLQAELGLSEEQMAQFMRDAAAEQNIPTAKPGAAPATPPKKKIPPLPASLR